MLNSLSLVLKCTLFLSVMSLFSGADVFISLILAQIFIIMAIDYFGYGSNESGTLIVQSIKNHIEHQRRNTRSAVLSVMTLCFAVGSVMFLVLPSFSSDYIIIPDLTGIRPFTAEANYMSLEGYVASYCLAHGRAISRGEARMMVKEALKAKKVTVTQLVDEEKKIVLSKMNSDVYMCDDCISKHVETAGCPVDCSCPSCRRSITLDRYNQMLKNYRSRSANTISTRPGRLTYCRGRVAVLPFNNLSGHNEAENRVYNAVADEFRNKGYSVIDADRISHLISNSCPCEFNEYDMDRIARCLEADMIVCGEIKKYSRYKKVRLAGLLLGGIISGVHNYGDVELSTKVFKASECAFIYDNVVSERRKDQAFGMFRGTGSIMNYSLAKAVEHLYRKF